MIENTNKVPKKQWKKWTESQRMRFNFLFETMRDNQRIFTHPKAPAVKPEHWKTVCWNAAWMSNDV